METFDKAGRKGDRGVGGEWDAGDRWFMGCKVATLVRSAAGCWEGIQDV